MASATESLPHNPFPSTHFQGPIHRSIPILPTSSASGAHMAAALAPAPMSAKNLAAPEPMDVTPTRSMGPPATTTTSPSTEKDDPVPQTNGESPHTNGTAATAVGAAAAAQQPKVVQTAFIHKLYNMLEDRSIQHLISWSSTNESFVMSPSTEFSKVLSSYFKHTNISSFVRQLNMYGFHKVSDVFHTGQPDSPLWEFKHGNGSFKRGDLVGLREIKRRASRHALLPRDSFSAGSVGPKASVVPAEAPLPEMPHTVEARLSVMEHNYFDMHARLARSEDQTAYLANKCVSLMEGLIRCHQWNQDLATYLQAAVPDAESPVLKDVAMMQREIARQTDILRSFDEPQSALPISARDPYFTSLQDNGPPLSPRALPSTDRRPSQPSLLSINEGRTPLRPPIAPHLAISPRRYGSIGSGNNTYSPSSVRTPSSALPPPPPPPALPQQQHPLANVTSSTPPANLPRRHTSADIRIHGWNGGVPPANLSPESTVAGGPTSGTRSPYASGQNSTAWPSSPHRNPFEPSSSNGTNGYASSRGDSQLQQTLANYQLPRGPRRGDPSSPSMDPSEPASASSTLPSAGLAPESAWQLPGARFSPFKTAGDTSGGVSNGSYNPFARRGSVQSNVHSLLNPAGAADDDEVGPDGERKRKRMQ